jgi:Ser/Thr protein kinase RdoA (MazF antagonist)
MDEAISSRLKKSYIEQTIRDWAGEKDYELLDDVQNIIYKIKIESESYILRFSHSSVRTNDDILSEIDWINYLVENHIPAAKPKRALDGSFTKIVAVDDSYFVASVFEYARGDFINTNGHIYWNTKFLRKWGSVVGRLHALTKKYDPGPHTKRRHEWRSNELVERAKNCIPSNRLDILYRVEDICQQIGALPKTTDTYGLIHYDLNPTNFFYHEGDITIFDFDDCCYNYFLHDISGPIPLYSGKFREPDWEKHFETFFRPFLNGYFLENTIKSSAFASLHVFLAYNNLCSVVFSFEIDKKNREKYDSYFRLVLDTYENGLGLFTYDCERLAERVLLERKGTGISF